MASLTRRGFGFGRRWKIGRWKDKKERMKEKYVRGKKVNVQGETNE